MSKHYPLRWALVCVAAVSLSVAASCAEASQTVTIKPGDSVDSLARKYHVSCADIARANHITPETILVDGRKLTIPDPPKTVKRAASMRRSARVTGDRISVRLGPDEKYRRLTMLDSGATLVVTNRAGEWLQASLPSGKSGWVRADFVALGGDVPAAKKVARVEPHYKATKKIAKSAAPRKVAAAASRKKQALAEKKRKQQKLAKLEKQRKHRKQLAAHKQHGKSRSAHRGHSRPEADAPDAESDVVRTALAYRGTPYRFGASGRGAFDCSGFTSHVYAKKGVSLPHSASEQFSHGKRVKSGSLKEGDLVFFHTTRKGISHVGIYVGEGKFVHASSGGGRVRVDSLNSGYYQKRLVGARRVK